MPVHRTQLLTGRVRAIAGAFAVAVVVAALTSGMAYAAKPGHAGAAATRGAAAAFGGQASLADVSCKGSSWCMAVGSYTTTDQVKHALAMTWNGTAWLGVKNPPGKSLATVSCSSRRFCMAAGGPTGAERWNGTTWRTMPSPAGGVAGVSCGSRTLCMKVYGGKVQSWNGTTWHLWASQTDLCAGHPQGPCGLAYVSCGNATNCVAVGTQTLDQEPVVASADAAWNGKSWDIGQPPSDGNPAGLNDVSCAGSFCLAAGGGWQEVSNGAVAVAGTFDATAGTWTDVSPDLGVLCTGRLIVCFWAGPMSCASPTACMVFSTHGHLWWNGTTWQPAPSVSAGPGSALNRSSCGGAACMAVGHQTAAGNRRTLAELWDGSTWTIIKTPMGP